MFERKAILFLCTVSPVHMGTENALRDIRARWEEKGWWQHPPGKAARKAREIYGGDGE